MLKIKICNFIIALAIIANSRMIQILCQVEIVIFIINIYIPLYKTSAQNYFITLWPDLFSILCDDFVPAMVLGSWFLNLAKREFRAKDSSTRGSLLCMQSQNTLKEKIQVGCSESCPALLERKWQRQKKWGR